MRVSWKRVLGVAALAGAVFWSISGVDLVEVVRIWSRIDRVLIAGVFLLTIADLLVRSWAWKLVIDPLKTVPYKDVASIYVIGLFSSLVLPFRMGDVAQGYFLGRRESISKMSTMSTVVVRRLFEMISLLVIMVGLILGFSFDFPLRQRGLLLGSVVLCGIGASYVLVSKRHEILSAMERVVGRFSLRAAGQLTAAVESALQGAAAIKRFRSVAAVMMLSLLAWFVEMLMILATASAMGIQLNLLESGVVLLTINLGLLVSPTPGNIGTYQFLSILALSWFSVSKARALSFSILFQIIQGIPVLIGGPFLLMIETNRTSTQPVRNRKGH